MKSPTFGFTTKPLSGWGRYPMESCHLYRPERRAEIAATLLAGTEASFISRGLGRSYGDAALNKDGGVMGHTRLNRFLSFDDSSGVLECESGVSLAEIIQYFLPRGWFPSVTPGTKFVTVGGALAADIHGKNHHRDGSFSNFVLDFQLLNGAGECLLCSPTSNAGVFWATMGGMGLTGIIASVRIKLRRVESAYVLVDYQRAPNLGEALAAMDAADDRYQYSVAWIDGLATGQNMGRGVLMRGNHAMAADLPRRIRNPLAYSTRPQLNLAFDFPSPVLNPVTITAFNTAYYALHHNGLRQPVNLEKFFYPLDGIRQWNRMYGKRGFVQYQIALPQASGHEALHTILNRLARSGRASFLAVLKRLGNGGPGLLSFPVRGYTLALDIPLTGGLVPFLHELDRMTLDYGGRIYLAKDAVLRSQDFAAMYPRLGLFQTLKLKLDPQGLLSSSLARRLAIVDKHVHPEKAR